MSKTDTEQALDALRKLHKHLSVFTDQDAPWYDEVHARVGDVIDMLEGTYDPSAYAERHQYSVTVQAIMTVVETYDVVAPTMADAEDDALAKMREDLFYVAQHPQHPSNTELKVMAARRVDVERP